MSRMAGRRFVSRRQLVKAVAGGAAALSLPGMATLRSARAQDAGEITIAGWSQPDGHMTRLVEAYTAQTGVKTNYVEMPAKWNDMVAKYTNLLQSGDDEIDVYLLDDFVITQFSAAGWIADISSALTPAEVDAWLPAVQEMFGFTGGIYRLPVFFGAGAFYYRADILESEGLAAPATWEELIAQGAQLAPKYPEMEIWAPMADTGVQAINYTIQTLWQGGGDPKVLNDAGSIVALQHMHDIIQDGGIAPNTITTIGADQTRALAKEGKQIMWWDFEGGLAVYDADDSPIKGKVGLAKFPAGPGGSWAMAHSWGWGVSEHSKNQEDGIAFAKWATDSPQLKEFMVSQAGLTPPKTETAQDPEVIAKLPFTTYLTEAADSLRFRVIDIPNPLQVHDIIGKTGSYVLSGDKSVEDAAEWGNEEMSKALAG